MSFAEERKVNCLPRRAWVDSNALPCSHVARTGEIKHFVVTEELGIAKGIRRVTALTGTRARDAQDLAQEAKEELDHIKTLSGKDKEKAAKAYLTVSQFPSTSEVAR